MGNKIAYRFFETISLFKERGYLSLPNFLFLKFSSGSLSKFKVGESGGLRFSDQRLRNQNELFLVSRYRVICVNSG